MRRGLDSPTKSVPARVRWKMGVFGLLETLSAFRQRLRSESASRRPEIPPVPDAHRAGSLWIFVSTIGELALVEPLLRRLLAELPGVPLTLISDRRIYRESYLRSYPLAYVYELEGTSADIARLAAITPPFGSMVVEIPCLLSDAPCRFPFAAVYQCRQRGVPLCLVNGWLYGYEPPSTLDRLEREWFGHEYVRSFDLITTQSEQVRDRLIEAGAAADRVRVTGNTKFDAMRSVHEWSPSGRPSERLLSDLRHSGRPLITAGSVTDPKDQELLLDAFADVLHVRPNALLVLAPRHPENTERTNRLLASLGSRGLESVSRQAHGDRPIPQGTRCLVLDTFGELRDFYAVCSAGFVGRNHNLLEPISFGKPTSTAGHWDTTFPSYPVYVALKDARAIREAESAVTLASIWTEDLSQASLLAGPRGGGVLDSIASLRGASERNLALLREEFVPRVLHNFASKQARSSGAQG